MASLQIIGGERTGEAVELDGDTLTVGRSNDNDLQLSADARMSRHHARLRRQGDDWLIEDLESANGTFIERGGRPERIAIATSLRDGDVIVVGSLRATVVLAPVPPEALETVILDTVPDQTVVVRPERAVPPAASVGPAPPVQVDSGDDFERTRVLGAASFTPTPRAGQAEELVPAAAPGLRPAHVASMRREGHRLLATLVVILPALILALVALYFTGIR